MSDDRIIDVTSVPLKQLAVRRYEALVMREFKSTIPAHLLANLPEDERFMVETMSKLENQYNWLAEGVVKTNGFTLDLDERLVRLEANTVSNAQRLGAMVLGALTVETLEHLFRVFKIKARTLAIAAYCEELTQGHPATAGAS